MNSGRARDKTMILKEKKVDIIINKYYFIYICSYFFLCAFVIAQKFFFDF